MCIFKNCPIFEKCEKELEQVVYCRHVEMIKKIAQVRIEMRKKTEAVTSIDASSQKAAPQKTTNDQIQVDQTSHSEQLNYDQAIDLSDIN